MNFIVISHLSTLHDEGIPLSGFNKNTTINFVDFAFTLSFILSAKQEPVIANFLKFFCTSLAGIELRVHPRRKLHVILLTCSLQL